MAFTVVYDACVLHPAPLRDLLIRIANTGLVRARWTERILDERFASILEQRQDLKPKALARTRQWRRTTTWTGAVSSSRPEAYGAINGLPPPKGCRLTRP